MSWPTPVAERLAGERCARVTTERKRAANRVNARLSTGPRTAAGKARVRQNAHRHGLNVAVADDPLLTEEVTRLARAICDGAPRGTARPGAELVQRSRNSNDIAIMHQPRPESLAEKEASDFGPVVIPSRLRFDEGAQHVLDRNHPRTISARWSALCKRHDG